MRFDIYKSNLTKWLFLVLALGLISSCSAIQTAKNDQVRISNYKELYFIPPKEDPRGIVPEVINDFEVMGFHVTKVDPDNPMIGLQGSGFVFTNSGHIITCKHVVGSAKEATIWIRDQRYEADMIDSSDELDIAILKSRSPIQNIDPMSFKADDSFKMGEDIFTMGYPMSHLLGNAARLTKGLISSTKGLKGDLKQIQISSEIQPGSSGGPVFDENGIVLGVVQDTLNPWKMVAQSGGALPQNVNFAIRSDVVLDFIKKNTKDVYDEILFDQGREFSRIESAVVMVKPGIMPQKLENAPKLVVCLEYESIWDIWYRFRFYVLSFYDFDSHELIFRAGQGGDNMVSTESGVIKDTGIEVRKILGISLPGEVE